MSKIHIPTPLRQYVGKQPVIEVKAATVAEAMDALVDLIHDIKQARQAGATDAILEAPRDFQRKASFYIDFVMSENSMGFHADGECLRVLGNAINFCRKGQLALRAASAGKPLVAQAKAASK